MYEDQDRLAASSNFASFSSNWPEQGQAAEQSSLPSQSQAAEASGQAPQGQAAQGQASQDQASQGQASQGQAAQSQGPVTTNTLLNFVCSEGKAEGQANPQALRLEIVKIKEKKPRSCPLSAEFKSSCRDFFKRNGLLIGYLILALILGWFLIHRGFWITLLYVLLISLAVYLAGLKQQKPAYLRWQAKMRAFFYKFTQIFKKGK